MNKKLTSLAQRRQRLVEQAATQRIVLVRNIEPFRQPLARVDQGLRVVQYVKQHPAFTIGATVVFSVLRRTRLGKWLQNAWVLSKLSLNLRELITKK